jgi:hypothetical protein
MILKGKPSEELNRMEMVELEDKMHKMGHTTFKYHCPHSIREEIPNPDGNIWIEKCMLCGKEII